MNCKHNWKESEYAQDHRRPNEYVYECQRCHEYRYATTNNVSAGSTVVHSGTIDQTEARTEKEKA